MSPLVTCLACEGVQSALICKVYGVLEVELDPLTEVSERTMLAKLHRNSDKVSHLLRDALVCFESKGHFTEMHRRKSFPPAIIKPVIQSDQSSPACQHMDLSLILLTQLNFHSKMMLVALMEVKLVTLTICTTRWRQRLLPESVTFLGLPDRLSQFMISELAPGRNALSISEQKRRCFTCQTFQLVLLHGLNFLVRKHLIQSKPD